MFSVYRYYGLDITLDEVIHETPRNPDGGTLAVFLAIAALKRGMHAVLYPYNLRVFDPTWFALPVPALDARLAARARVVRSMKLRKTIRAYRRFLRLGGALRFEELTTPLLRGILHRGRPILTGLSSTYLYRSMRERQDDMVDDDIRGEPTGHFVVLSGYERAGYEFTVCDPYGIIPFSGSGSYTVTAPRLINSILLGDLTYDAVLLELWPTAERRKTP